MPDPRRILRLQQLVLEVVAEALTNEVEDPRIGLVSITRVRLSPDLTTGTVWWSSLEQGPARRTTERGLEDALALLQRRVAAAMGTRVTPRLSLRFDPTLERQQRMDEIFRKLREERGEPPEPDQPVPPEAGAPER
jgi:ribosome-binding factor A